MTPESAKIDGGENSSLMHIIGRTERDNYVGVITYQYTRMISIDIFRFYILLVNVVHLRLTFTVSLYYIPIYPQQLTISEKDPWVPAPLQSSSLSVFLLSEILWGPG